MPTEPVRPSRWVGPGQPWPLGVTCPGDRQAGGVRLNVAVWAPDAEAIECCVFDALGQHEVQRVALTDCTEGVWHACIEIAGDTLVYGLRAHGPWQPEAGHRFNPAKVLLDPWAREVVGCYADELSLFDGHQAGEPGRRCERDNAVVAMKGRWRRANPPPGAPARPPGHRVPWDRTVLYEAHVKGLTQRHPGVPADLRGRYAGVAHPVMLAHYRRLGVTTLSLLPVHARADEARLQRLGLSNYWGYNSIGFFAPEPRYACVPAEGEPGVDVNVEFRRMVDDLHGAGLEVVLDVVFNHTAESDAHGPTLSLRGLANARCYRLEAGDRARYVNWTGCGNCLDLSQPRVLELVLASLRHWVLDLGVDGFRFDLAPVLARDAQGHFDPHAPFLAALQADPVLSRVKLIAEPWDIGPGGYQLGAFPAGWREWNDRFRDEMRQHWLGRHSGSGGPTRGAFAHRFAGSSQQFRHDARPPSASVNFITAHDGFTLRDLVSYQHKRNLPNGEGNRDGHGDNHGWHGGVDGATDDAIVLARRLCLSRALLATLLLSQGTPMLLAGDELGHTQEGNNNAYCQDNPVTWLDWTGPDADDLSATVARLLQLRRTHGALRQARWLTGQGDVQWLHPEGHALTGDGDWHADDPCLVIVLTEVATGDGCWVLSNASAQPRLFTVRDAAAAGAACAFDSAAAGGDPKGPEGRRQGPGLGGPGVVLPAHSLQVWHLATGAAAADAASSPQ